MGKSAKLHKRIPKRLKSSSSSSATSTATTSQSQVHMAKKRATLKEKAGKGNTAHDSKRVLGDVDYVALMMGGRRKAKQEAEKHLLNNQLLVRQESQCRSHVVLCR
ncbi:hypothetical protein L208DRAFT_1390806 [Tricholoma matsutake]|nr:hypothetical protein L208DRAFT_1390806 [Tricholoma matsutake 945]